MLLYKADGKFTSQHNKLIKLLLQYNKIQYFVPGTLYLSQMGTH